MKAKRRFLPITVIGLLLILALATVGVVATLWVDTLEVNGVVKTGSLNAGFTCPNCWDREWKEVGDCTATVIAGPQEMSNLNVEGKPVGLAKDSGNDKVHFVIENAYPGYLAVVSFNIKNIGTIPLHVNPIKYLNGMKLDPDGDVVIKSVWCTPVLPLGADETAVAEMAEPEVQQECIDYLQLHEGEFVRCWVKMEVMQSADEKAEYKGCVQFPAWQYNEEPELWQAGPCVWPAP